MEASKSLNLDWLYGLKRKILFSMLLVLTLSIVATMAFIAIMLHNTLVSDSKLKTRELAIAIETNLEQLMLQNSPDAIQGSLEHLARENESLRRIFILNNEGRIAYSSDPQEVGTQLNQQDSSCRICHEAGRDRPRQDDVVLETEGSIHRNIILIKNVSVCHACHDPANAINGKLVIDRDLESTFSLITGIELVLFGSGLVCLLVLIPLFSRLLTRGINQYIMEIFSRNEELRLLYVMVERLSKTLDTDLLKEIVIEIFKDVLDAEEVELILPRGEQQYSSSVWTVETGRIKRRPIDPGTPVHAHLESWLAGTLDDTVIAKDVGEICMPIKKGDHRLALIVAKKRDRFDAARLKLCAVISGHVAVAFDNARLYTIAITDELTGTYTKRHFRYCIDETFADYKQYGNRFALLMMDLDNFKRVNDQHGHVVGDEVLRQLGDILRTAIRENDQAFRYGGEEFTVILPSTDVEGAQFVAERIRSATEQAVFIPDEQGLKLTISIGMATCPGAPSVHELVVAADEALYAAKKAGRNRIVLSKKDFSGAD